MSKTAKINDWSDIHFAYQVAKLGTLSGAAAVLEVHHSTVLRRIEALEKRLNTKLFLRHPRGYIPTDAGKLLLEVATNTQESFDKLVGQLSDMDHELSGKIIVTSVNNFSFKITPILAEFQSLYPEIKIDFAAVPRILKLDYGEAHISIRPGAQPQDPDYITQRLQTLKTTLYASHDYIEEHGTMKNLRDIRDHRFVATIAPLKNIPHMRWIRDCVPTENVSFQVTDFYELLQAVELGLGIAPLNCWHADHSDKVTRLFSPPKMWDSELWLITHKSTHRTKKIQALTKFLKQRLRN